jgi:CBS domain-containing protein
MSVSDVMTRDVAVVDAATTLTDAAKIMRGLDVGVLPVRSGQRLVGVLTDRDITIRATAGGKDPESTSVAEVMTPNIVSCGPQDDVSEVARTMQAHKLRRVLVLDDAAAVVGIVSLGDLAVRADEPAAAGKTLERVSEPDEKTL